MNKRTIFLKSTGIIFCLIFFSQFISGQQDRKIPTSLSDSPNDFHERTAIKSPEILPDNRVVLRLFAPNVSSVSAIGEWNKQRGVFEDMEKDDKGVWSLTVGPLKPEIYGYNFIIDGVKVLDPNNIYVRRDGIRYENFVLVPGKESELYTVNNVPHGTLSKVWYNSPTLGHTKRMYVYTPPSYDNNTNMYPVLYLFHGGGGDEDAWTDMGRACQILDNLIAQGNARPMIVVMPNFYGDQIAARVDVPLRKISREEIIAPQTTFESSLVADILPYVEKHYRVIVSKNSRAIAGLSFGAGVTLNIAKNNPDKFDYIGIFSSQTATRSLTLESNQDFEVFKKNNIKLFWTGCGVDDPAYNGMQTLVEILKMNKINFVWKESEGGHTWANWRFHLSEFVPLLFY